MPDQMPPTGILDALTAVLDSAHVAPEVFGLRHDYLLHQVPLGGEDLGHYRGAPRLIRATGEESFDTTANGERVIEHPEPGEVVWCDDAGVTCRRWNWRQCSRTSLTDETTTAVFILDALDPMNDDELAAATDALADALTGLGIEVRHSRRLIGAA